MIKLLLNKNQDNRYNYYQGKKIIESLINDPWFMTGHGIEEIKQKKINLEKYFYIKPKTEIYMKYEALDDHISE